MPSGLVRGFTHKLLNVSQKLTLQKNAILFCDTGVTLNLGATPITTTGNVSVGGVLQIPTKANPATCTVNDINALTGKLYICSATNTWTVVGTQV